VGVVTVVVPWRIDPGHEPPEPERVAALEWVARQVARDLPGAVFFLATQQAEPWEFSKAEAIRDAARIIDGEGVVVVHDADVWSPGTVAMVKAVERGLAPWAQPHKRVYRLAQTSTRSVLRGAAPAPTMATVKRPYRGVCGGAIVVLPAGLLSAVPPDPRFRGWGSEDRSWCDALRTLAPPGELRGSAPLFHLWHPPFLNDEGEHRTTVENAALALRYRNACHQPDLMADLMAEAGVLA
jgi:hypothetical protein